MSESDAAKQEEDLSKESDEPEEPEPQDAGPLLDEDQPAGDGEDAEHPGDAETIDDGEDAEAAETDAHDEGEEAALPLGIEDMIESPEDQAPGLEEASAPADEESADGETTNGETTDGELAPDEDGEDAPGDEAFDDASDEDDIEASEVDEAETTDLVDAEEFAGALSESPAGERDSADPDEFVPPDEEEGGEESAYASSETFDGVPAATGSDETLSETEEDVETLSGQAEEPVMGDLWSMGQDELSTAGEEDGQSVVDRPDDVIDGDADEWSAAPLPPIMEAPAGGFSADVAVERFDSLDRACLGFAVARGHPGDWAVDLGCGGAGLQGLRLALAGMNALLVDLRDLGDRVDDLRERVPVPSLQVLRKDLRSLEPADLPRPLRVAYCQRTIHFMNYEEALRLITMLAVALETGGRLFLSAAGLESTMGHNYAGRDQPIAERYGLLAPAQARAHDIHEPVCLYTTEDLRVLAAEAGLSEVRIWPSERSNLKGIFEKR